MTLIFDDGTRQGTKVGLMVTLPPWVEGMDGDVEEGGEEGPRDRLFFYFYI